MFEITVESDFAAAHRLREYDGNCERLHGHNWRVELTVAAEALDGIGLAVDFRRVRRWLSEALKRFDHKYLNEVEEFRDRNPTCELIAKSIYDHVNTSIAAETADPAETAGTADPVDTTETENVPDAANRLTVARVRVWESPGASVTYGRS
ncbi:MAG TPA: 6-carboxytetrahydropterin synthase QueD [bacterium]|nr:6-carboxytetrahydropterin synthase QueD [bacterium]